MEQSYDYPKTVNQRFFSSLSDYQVGYRVRFEDNTGPGTKIIYQTDGMLLREAMLDHRYVLTLKY